MQLCFMLGTVQDLNLFIAVKQRLEKLDAKLSEGVPVFKNLVQGADDIATIQGLKNIMSHGTGTGGASTETKAAKMASYVVGDIYSATVQYRDRCDGLVEAMNTMTVSLFDKEFWCNDKGTFNCASFKKLLDDRTLILEHLRVAAVENSLREMLLD